MNVKLLSLNDDLSVDAVDDDKAAVLERGDRLLHAEHIGQMLRLARQAHRLGWVGRGVPLADQELMKRLESDKE